MSWEDDDFSIEYVKFTKAGVLDDPLAHDFTFKAYLEVLWDTIEKYTNLWNKNRMKVQVHTLRLCVGTPFTSDESLNEDNLWLDMGARLYNTIKKLAKDRPKYVKIIKDTNPQDKFDTWYRAFEYKAVVQSRIKKKSKN